MRVVALLAGLVLIGVTLFDAFETILLPRRVNRWLRIARLYYRTGWSSWRWAASLAPAGAWREAVLAVFGPVSMLGLFGSWVVGLIVGFALLLWSLPSPLTAAGQPGAPVPFAGYLYYSGTTFITLGLGDVAPQGHTAHALAVVEAGLGFGFLAVIISYLPVLYQAFSRREVTISLFDARAGSPPTAGELLLRLARAGRLGAAGGADALLGDWERWCAELLESHLSFPVLAYYRSQHANQSWLSALTTMLDSCALLLSCVPAADAVYPAQLTFAMARHASVDIALIFAVRPRGPRADRLPPADRAALLARLREAGVPTDDSADADRRLAELRGAYEPFLAALADHFVLALPPAAAPAPESVPADNWQRSAWMPRPPGIGSLPAAKADGNHFD